MEAIVHAVHAVTGMGPIGAAAAGVGATAAVGSGLFTYNRGNYQLDQKLHYDRYIAANTLAIAQTKQYREDVTDLSELTCKRMDTYHAVSAMSLTILTALFCPGRLGLHAPPPPQWLMGLFMVNLGACYLWLGLTMWLAMHASIRADTAATHLLTRFVRLPIPSSAMLDRARKFMASYEEMPLKEVLRLPFTKHQSTKSRKGEKIGVGYNESKDIVIDPDVEARARHGFDVPLWYRKEKGIDEHGMMLETMLPYKVEKGDAPEHFDVYREVQNEWWPYDVYARICIFLACMHLFHAWTYQQMGHGLQETRAIFAVGTVVIALSVLQQIIMYMDVNVSRGQLPLEKIGPFAQIFAYIAAGLEYRRWYNPQVQAFGFFLVYVAYIIHAVYTIQLFRVCRPLSASSPEDTAGAAWWPGKWTLPSAFAHAVWLVAPPSEMDPHQNDLAQEMRTLGKSCSTEHRKPKVLDAEEREDVHFATGNRGETPAWTPVKIGLLALIIAWVWMLLGFTVEIATQGTLRPSFLSAPGMPNNARDPRWRRPKPGREELVEVGTGGRERAPFVGEKEEGESDGRLLSPVADRRLVMAQLHAILPSLDDIARGALAKLSLTFPLRSSSQPSSLASDFAPAQRVVVQWPPLFEPRLLCCIKLAAGTHAETLTTLLLSHTGRGAVVNARRGGPETTVTSFTLEGVADFGILLSASWDDSGLLLTTAAGVVLHCPSNAASIVRRWGCSELPGARLPLGPRTADRDFFPGAAAVVRHPDVPENLLAVVAFLGEDSLVFFKRFLAVDDANWVPVGEARIPRSHAEVATPVVALAFESPPYRLLVSFQDGTLAVVDVVTGRGTPLKEAAASVMVMVSSKRATWQGSCGFPGGNAAHLLLELHQSSVATSAWEPTLLLSVA